MERNFKLKRLKLEEKRLQDLASFRDEQLKLQREQLALKQKTSPEGKSQGVSPIVVTIIAAILGLSGTVIGAYLQGRSNLELERQKLESNLILKAIETGDPDKAAKNLRFLAKVKLISLPPEQIKELEENPNDAPVLPSIESSALSSANDELVPSTSAIRAVRFGNFSWRSEPLPGNPEHIRILDDWVEQNIIEVEIPQLRGIRGAPPNGRVQFHKNYATQLKQAFAEIEELGLLKHVLTWDGSFEPRTMIGSRHVLSSHAYGAAFDINREWNLLGQQTASDGEDGNVRELVPIFEKYGFYWGGKFQRRLDGAHFEIVR